MKLMYRGQTYDYNPAPTTAQAGQNGKTYQLTYRGAAYQANAIDHAQVPAASPVDHKLSYRGTPYHLGQNAQGLA